MAAAASDLDAAARSAAGATGGAAAGERELATGPATTCATATAGAHGRGRWPRIPPRVT